MGFNPFDALLNIVIVSRLEPTALKILVGRGSSAVLPSGL